jgi:hypothetical protein
LSSDIYHLQVTFVPTQPRSVRGSFIPCTPFLMKDFPPTVARKSQKSHVCWLKDESAATAPQQNPVAVTLEPRTLYRGSLLSCAWRASPTSVVAEHKHPNGR